MDVKPIRAFRDNYIWLLRAGRAGVVVDPGAAAPVIEALSREGIALKAILATHHHADHVGGIPALLERFDVPVFGPAAEAIPSVTHKVCEPETILVPGIDIEFAVLDIPGHTRGHIAYYGSNMLFCGDTLFGCGCGRLFEGTPAQMWASLSKLAALPGATRIYCGHEYTQANIRFASVVEPHNAALQQRQKHVDALRARDEPTLPATLEEELATNPFLRGSAPAVIEAARRLQPDVGADPVSVFALIREWKNRF